VYTVCKEISGTSPRSAERIERPTLSGQGDRQGETGERGRERRERRDRERKRERRERGEKRREEKEERRGEERRGEERKRRERERGEKEKEKEERGTPSLMGSPSSSRPPPPLGAAMPKDEGIRRRDGSKDEGTPPRRPRGEGGGPYPSGASPLSRPHRDLPISRCVQCSTWNIQRRR